MSERYERGEEAEERRRQLGPSIDAKGRRRADPYEEEGAGKKYVARGEEEPASSRSRGGSERQERGRYESDRRDSGRAADSSVSSGQSTATTTSWVSVIYGWLAALGASLILSGIVGGIIGAIFLGASRATGGSSAATQSGAAGLVGLLVTLLLAFVMGGYVAGRLASRQGAKHGLLVALVALVVTLVLAVIGGLVGINFISTLSNVTLPGLPNDAPQNLGTIFTISGILALVLPFLGGAMGGAWGASTGRRRP